MSLNSIVHGHNAAAGHASYRPLACHISDTMKCFVMIIMLC